MKEYVISFKLAVLQAFERIEHKLDTIIKKETIMAGELELLRSEVEETSGAVDSIITLVTGLSDYIKAHANDPAALLAYAAQLDAQQTKIADAVAANPLPSDNPPV